MSRTPTYRVKFRRRREEKTDYYARIKLLSSSKTRLVARVTNSRIIAHLTDYSQKGDKTLFNASSKELSKHGWKGGSNIPAAYLTGYLLGTKAKSKVNEAILDIGLRRPVPGSKVFAVAKGLQDSGVKISIGAVVPSKERLSGAHIEEYAKKLSDGDRKKLFSKYIKNGIDPTKFSQHVQEVKKKMGVTEVKKEAAEEPQTEEPKAEKPKTEKPKTEKPKAEKPKTEKPKPEQKEKPEKEKPMKEKPKKEKKEKGEKDAGN